MKYIKQYISRITGSVILFSFLLPFISCNEDLGNYDYTDINEIIITNIEEVYNMSLGGNFDIQPKLTFTQGHEDECSYRWLFLRRSSDLKDKEPYLIATTKNLQVPVAGEIGKLGNDYIYYYIVKNEVTGIEYAYSFQVNITTEINSGYLILNDVNGQTRVDMLSYYDSEFTHYTDITELFGGTMPKDGKPIQLTTYIDYNAPTVSYGASGFAITILTDKGTYRLHPLTFEYSEDYSISQVIFNDDPELFPNGHIAEQLHSSLNNEAYMYLNNNWYYYYYTSYMGFNLPINTMSDTYKRYSPAPYIISGGSKTVLFNTETQSFVTHSRGEYSTGPGSIYSAHITGGETYFPYNNINQENLELVYMGQRAQYIGQSSTSARGYMVFKNVQTGEYFVGRIIVQSLVQESFDRIEGETIKNANFYAFNPADGSSTSNYLFLYYATDSEIYMLRFQYNAGGKMTPEKVWEAPAGHKISFMKYVYAGPSSSNPLVYDWRNYLAVATYDPNDTEGNQGTLQFLVSTPLDGDFSIAKDQEGKEMCFDGFGKIVGVGAKYK